MSQVTGVSELAILAVTGAKVVSGGPATTGMGQYPELEYGRKMSRTWSPVTHVITGLFWSMKGRLFCVYCLPIPVENELTYHEAGNKQEMARKVNILPAYHDSW